MSRHETQPSGSAATVRAAVQRPHGSVKHRPVGRFGPVMVAGLFAGLVFAVSATLPNTATAQDGSGRVAKEIFLDDEELNVEADLPSVDLVLTFKGLRYENIDPKTTFFPELYKTVESDPF